MGAAFTLSAAVSVAAALAASGAEPAVEGSLYAGEPAPQIVVRSSRGADQSPNGVDGSNGLQLVMNSALRAPADRCLALEDVIRRAAVIDPRVEGAEADHAVQQAELRALQSERFPQLDGFSRAGLGDGVRADNQLDNRIGVRISQRLFGFGAGRLARKSAAAEAERAEYDIDIVKTLIAVEAAEAYFSFLRSQERLEAASELVSFYERDAELVKRRLDQNLLTASEANSIHAEHALATAREVREELNIAEQQERLSSLLDEAFTCGDGKRVESFLQSKLPDSLDAATRAAALRSPELGAARADVRARGAESKRIARAALPQLSVGGSVAYDYDDLTDEFIRNERVGFDVSAPLFQAGRNRFTARAARARLNRAKADLAQAERALLEHVSVSWTRVQYLKTVQIRQFQVRESFSRLSSSIKKEHDIGALTLSELIDAKRDHHNAVLAEIDVRYELHAQELSLLADTGKLIPNAPPR